MSVVGHDNATEQHRHYARQLETLCQEVRTKRKEEPHGKLQRMVLAKVNKLKELQCKIYSTYSIQELNSSQ